MLIRWNASLRGRGAFARLRRSALAGLLVAFASGAHAAAPAPVDTPVPAAPLVQVRLVAANAAAATAVFAVDGELQSIRRGEHLAAASLRLVHVGAHGVLIERIDTDADRAARFQLAVGATLPAPPSDIKPGPVLSRASSVEQFRPVQSRQGADTDAPIQ